MYERFYNFRERPFALSPDPEYFYLSRVHSEALDYLRYGLESQAGFIVITGEIGSGKTTLLQSVLQRLDNRTTVARIVNTTLEPRELLEAILIDFGLEPASTSKPMLLRQLGEFLVKQRLEGRRSLLVVDEAQNLSSMALEEIRLLSNQETEKSKLLQIVLVGQPNLRDTLSSPELEQLRQRVAVSYHLTPLDADDTVAYLARRLEQASLGRPLQFPGDGAQLIHARSRGVPRTINIIADAALVFGYAEGRHDIDLPLIEEVVQELEATGVLRPVGAPGTVQPAVAAAVPAAAPRRIDASAPGRVEAAAAGHVEAAAEPGREVLQRRLESVAQIEAELVSRATALTQRERELAEQRRIMAEEYRLLRRDGRGAGAPSEAAATGTTGRVRASSPAAAAAGIRQRPVAVYPRVPPRRDRMSFWQRLFRLLAGEPVRL